MAFAAHLETRLPAVLVLALAAGCAMFGSPKVERYVAPPLGTSWETARHDSGSYGSGSGRISGRRGERLWQGRMMITFEAAGAPTIIAAPDGHWHGLYAGDKPLITWDPPLTWEWPLELGKSWTREQRATFGGKQTVTYSVTQKVEAYEDVKVPAGTFKAWKISTATSLGDENLVWFSPDHGIFIKQSLKRTARHAQGAGTREVELLSYKRAN
jgi:hypothetical protein